MNPEISVHESAIQVLLIEDDPVAARILKKLIESEKNPEIHVECASRVEEGLSALSRIKTDCILLDLNLPDSLGLETVARVQNKASKIPIVVLAGNDNDTLAIEAVRRGVQDYVMKDRVDGKILSRIIRYAVERKRFDEALRESEARHREIAENIPGAVYQFLLNPKTGATSFPFMSSGIFQILEIQADAIQADGAKAFSMILPEDIEFVNRSIAESAQNMTTWMQEFRIKTMNGQIKWLRATSSPHLLSSGEIIWNGVILDVTDLKNTQAELQNANMEIRNVLNDLRKTHHELKTTQSQLIQAEKMDSVGRLAAGIAHEVKNPLAIMLQGIEYLSGIIPASNLAALSALRDIEEAVGRADSVIRGLLDFSSVSESVFRPENIHDVIEEALTLSRHEFERLQITVTKDFQKDLPRVKIDQNRMQQVFLNLFLNSIYAMEKGGELTITTKAQKLSQFSSYIKSRHNDNSFEDDDLVVLIEVADTGTGIPADILSKIFEPFFTTRRGKGGTGLGLPIVKSIVEMHNGRIQLVNQKTGGVKASIILKVYEEKTL